jgi:predicted ATPase
MILSLLFSTLFSSGVVLVATSNRPPEALYEDGLNRSYFLPFIDDLKRHCVVHDMGSSTDYRLLNAAADAASLGAGMYPSFYNVTEESEAVDSIVQSLRRGMPGRPRSLSVPLSSRRIRVPSVDDMDRVGRFGCADLCDQPLGAADFRAVATSFDCVAIDSIPVLSTRRHNVARRFITLVDELYEARTPLLCSAAAPPSRLLQVPSARCDNEADIMGDDGGSALASVRELSFAFRRASSRLEEMTSRSWWDKYFPKPSSLHEEWREKNCEQ